MDLKAMIEKRMEDTEKAHTVLTGQIVNTERELTAMTTKRVELASIYNADKELLKSYNANEGVGVKPIPKEVIEEEKAAGVETRKQQKRSKK